jgi:hypothetical protein
VVRSNHEGSSGPSANRHRFSRRFVRGRNSPRTDLQIQNAHAANIAQRLPEYFGKACPQTTSFILLPLLSDSSPIACMLVGRDVAEPDPITPEDIRLLRTVRGQIILAMKTAR